MARKTLRVSLMTAAVCALLSSPLLAQDANPPAAAPATPSTAPATGQMDPNKVVLTIGDKTFTIEQFVDFINLAVPPQYRQMATQGQGRRMVVDELVKMQLLAAEARNRKLDQTPDYQERLAMLQSQLLANTLQQNIQETVPEEKLRQYYDEHKAEFETAKARHILIRAAGSPAPLGPGKQELTDEQAKAKAQEIRQRIEKGEDFAAIAKAESDDPQSGARGGELGTFARAQMVAPFAEAVFSMKPGELSQPVKTQFGYHVIQVQERQTEPFELAKTEIAAKLAPQLVAEVLKNAQANTKVEIDEDFFGPAAMPTMPGGMPAGHPPVGGGAGGAGGGMPAGHPPVDGGR